MISNPAQKSKSKNLFCSPSNAQKLAQNVQYDRITIFCQFFAHFSGYVQYFVKHVFASNYLFPFANFDVYNVIF